MKTPPNAFKWFAAHYTSGSSEPETDRPTKPDDFQPFDSSQTAFAYIEGNEQGGWLMATEFGRPRFNNGNGVDWFDTIEELRAAELERVARG